MKIRCENCNCEIEFLEIQDKVPQCPTCGSEVTGAELEDTVTVLKNENCDFHHFRLQERLGVGHFGTVWKAYDNRLHRTVALKVPNKMVSNSEQRLFLREAQSAARLDHPNIVAIYEVGIGDNPYISTKFIDGITLRDGMNRFEGDFRKTAELIRCIASALKHSHENGIIHRDLKPANILLDVNNVPYVADFGLAKQIGADVTIAKDGAIIGTPAYMPPEQAEGRLSDIDARSDVYSLGIVLYEMLSGKRPFVATSQRALLFQIIHDDPTDIRLLKKNIPSDLCNICMKAIDKEPANRYQSAAELEEDLARFLRHEPTIARPWPMHRRIMRHVRKKRAAILVTFLAIAAIFSLAFALSPRKPDWWGNAKNITLETDPPGAFAVFLPMNTDTGIPLLGQEIRLPGVSPFKTRLPPGTYRVTAWKSDSLFHEVIRTVPASDQQIKQFDYSNSWVKDKDGNIEIGKIRLFEQEKVTQDFCQVSAGARERSDRFLITSNAFLIAKSEATVGDLKRSKIDIPVGMQQEKWGWKDNERIGFVNYWRAMNIVEALGWVPTCDEEYDFAFLSLRESDAEVAASLQDLKQEWSGPSPYAVGRFTIRTQADEAANPTGREFMDHKFFRSTLGFRGFRPIKPRIKASDFIQITELR